MTHPAWIHRDKWLLVLAGAAAAGGAYYYYQYYYKPQAASAQAAAAAAAVVEYKQVTLTIEKGHSDWLQEMVVKHSLSDTDAALRTCLDFAVQPGSEKLIYGKIKNRISKHDYGVTDTHAIEERHDQFLEGVVVTHHLIDKSKAAQFILDYCSSDLDDAVLFSAAR